MSLESGHRETKVFSSESVLRNPGRLLIDMGADLKAGWQLAGMLAYRDLKAQFRQSILGWIWLVIPPIAWTVGMTVLRRNNLADLGATDLYYPAYVLIGMALWQIFTNSLTGPMTALSINKGILTKVRFPRESLIVAEVMKLSVIVVVQFLLICGAFVFYRLPLTPTFFVFPVAIFGLVALGTFLGLILAPVGMLYRDVGNMLPYLTMGGLAITPVIFPMPPITNDGVFATVVRWNPVTPLVTTARELATGETLTQFPQFVVVTVLSVVGCYFGLAVLRVMMPVMIERWSS